MAPHELRRTQLIPSPLEEVFPFFADPKNLERITPPFLRFRITSPDAVTEVGAEFTYRLQLFGVPFGWRTLIEEFEPGRLFVDRQIRGPYKLWHHTHTFDAVGTSTRMTDVVRYEIGFGPAGTLAHQAFVKRTLDRIFDYRAESVAAVFQSPAFNSAA